MYSNNKFAKMDSIANLIKTILEADTKAKMEELKGGQHKIDKNKNNKIDAQDFKILRGEKKVEESSHQAKTTMKHVKNPTAGEKAAAKDIKPGIAGYRDRIDMLKSAEARGGLKKEEAEQVDEAGVKEEDETLSEGRPYSPMHRIGRYGSTRGSSYLDLGGRREAPPASKPTTPAPKPPEKSDKEKEELWDYMQRKKAKKQKAEAMNKEEIDEAKEPGFRASYGIGRKGSTAKKATQASGRKVQGRGYDSEGNERKAPEGHAPVTSLMPGHDERAARFLARQAKGKVVKGKAQSAPQKEDVQIDEMKAGASAGNENKFHKKLDKLVHGTFGASSDEKKMKKEEIDPKKTVTDTLKGREKTSDNPFLSKKVVMDVPGNVKEQKTLSSLRKKK
jgi:hypothetical protein